VSELPKRKSTLRILPQQQHPKSLHLEDCAETTDDPADIPAIWCHLDFAIRKSQASSVHSRIHLHLESYCCINCEEEASITMFAITKPFLQSTATSCLSKIPNLVRQLGTHVHATRKEGDISSVFVSLSGVTPEPLPRRFADIKRQLIQGNEVAVTTSWKRLLEKLAVANETVKLRGSDIIPQIQFKELQNPSREFIAEIKNRGVAVIRGVVPEHEARGYKNEVEEYVKLNPSTKGTLPSILFA
jgi:Protein of unknown function (DUF1479)